MEQETQIITKDMTMGEIIQKWPSAADIMQSFGLHCFGCQINVFESLEQGVLGHGMDEKTMEDLLKELNYMAGKEKTETPKKSNEDLTITDLAATKLKELIEKQGKQGYGIRVSVVPGGCAGYRYDMDFEKIKQNDDHTIKINEIEIFVDNESFDFLKGVTIDYVETLQGAGFKFDNPNATAACGCGKSFH